jgi:protein-S-isoprenylcysteine O-methyltransferase Ste14
MSGRLGIPTADNQSSLVAGIIARFGQVIVLLAFQAAILFLAAGQLDWMWAWVFMGIYLVGVCIMGAFLMRTSPETIAERGRAKGMRDWDKLVGGLWSLAQFIAIPLVAGLDVRFGWLPEASLAWHVVGAVLFALGLGIFGWAMITNAYFSTVARVQDDRGQTVCRSGPYQCVRHPGYIGAILQSLGIPLLLGSWWALIPGVPAAVLMGIRTCLEDRMLQAELPGYKDFTQEVRYRLIPGIW